MRSFVFLFLLFLGVSTHGAELINLYDPQSVAAHAPVIVGHRGGAVVEGIPENSLAAMQLAAERGYAMVEIDVRATADGVPVAFHDNEMAQHVGVAGEIESLNLADVRQLHYLEGPEFRILSVDESLAEASRLKLGVMLDIKSGQDSEAFYNRIREALVRNGLTTSTLTISRHENTRRYLGDIVMQRVTNAEWDKVKAGETLDLSGKFWFDWPRYISNAEVAELRSMGALIIPSINVFHYPEAEHMARAAEDIEKMRDAGVHAYQIDAPYDQFILDQ